MRAGIALGANLGGRRAGLTTARAEIFRVPGVEAPFLASSLYETEPVDCEMGAAKFLNAVVEIDFAGAAADLLRELQRIEQSLGRPAAHKRNRSRTIDLDLLYLGHESLAEPGLTLPHPRLGSRAFVLQPLAEIRPDLILPNESETIRQLADKLPATPSVVRLPLRW
ncbi:MAG: 2-amino-4-hydroxy-6-hydroxymethyldihydropteridine diphosphokinase [Chthoniobacterales bacterium]